jgi:hypothetical protein
MEDNIKMKLRKVRHGGVNGIELTKDMVDWRVFLIRVYNMPGP